MFEELTVEKHVRTKLKKQKGICKFVPIWGSSLYHIDDLAYDPVDYTPNSYTGYRRENERAQVRDMFPNPKEGELPLPDLHEDMSPEQIEAFKFMPCLHGDFGFSQEEVKTTDDPDERTYFVIKGGEKAALERVEGWMHERDCLGIYKQTRDGFIGPDFSSKLSPWLSNGCLSIRRAYWETKRYEKEKKANPSTTHFISELFWRDFFRFWCLSHGNQIFSAYGILKRANNVW
jgi:deoxyribodipyrimidine photo-lyase